ncbi:MAG TPA: tRNA (adenosine(37)-N6)-threonylcarbamoyltransferase complex dimerization subunit type 1 TsaB, partial [Verrucomicrobiae bacterium]|nr:tRNA (adenosine(37)-N6)-threonylcarbamoyltransferase complex dimerization subunit type 1 TsaB [Verrucomicrobiae bacterium]
MKILALEFSSSQRSVAVVQTNDARGNFAESEVMETCGRGVNAISMMGEALRQAEIEREQIEVVAVGIGPGSYMGIRGAIAVAQGWQLARRVKLLGISSVECIAAQAQSEGFAG